MAQQAISPLFGFALFCEKAPVNWHSSRVTEYCLSHAPYQHQEEDMEDGESELLHLWFADNHVLVDKDEVVERDEAENTCKMRVDKLAAIYLSHRHDRLKCFD